MRVQVPQGRVPFRWLLPILAAGIVMSGRAQAQQVLPAPQPNPFATQASPFAQAPAGPEAPPYAPGTAKSASAGAEIPGPLVAPQALGTGQPDAALIGKLVDQRLKEIEDKKKADETAKKKKLEEEGFKVGSDFS